MESIEHMAVQIARDMDVATPFVGKSKSMWMHSESLSCQNLQTRTDEMYGMSHRRSS